MIDLTKQTCKPCEGGTAPLTREQCEKHLSALHEWVLDKNAAKITRQIKFKNFYQTISFVNAVAWIANKENHHPDIEAGYNYCTIHLRTHAINGLSINDFIVAAKIDLLF